MKLLYSKFSVLFLLLAVTTIGAADPATVQLLSLGRMNEAISALSNRGDPESFNLLSRAYYAMERWDDAVRWGERAVAERPQDAELSSLAGTGVWQEGGRFESAGGGRTGAQGQE